MKTNKTMENRFKNPYQSPKTRNIKPLPFTALKSIQEFSLLIQKKVFTKKLWAYYKLKNFKENSMIFGFYQSTRTSISSSSFINMQRVSVRSDTLYNNQVAGTSKIVSAVKRVFQKNMMKAFWGLYLTEKNKEFENHGKNIEKIVSCLGKLDAKENFLLKKHALNNFKINFLIKSKFLSYIISNDSKKGARIICNTLSRKIQIKFAKIFKIIQNHKLSSRKHSAFTKILLFINDIQYRFKQESYKLIKSVAKQKKSIETIALFVNCVDLTVKTRLTFSFYQVKYFKGKKNAKFERFFEIVSKKCMLQILLSFGCLRRYWKMPGIRNTSEVFNRPLSKLITLPTIFLSGDPGGGISKEEYTRSFTSKGHATFLLNKK